MTRHATWWIFAVALMVFGTASQAQARPYRYDNYDPTRIYGGVWLGFGGDIEVHEVDAGKMGKTFGGLAGVDVRVARWFSLGGEFRIAGFDVGKFDGRSRFIDLDFKPRLYIPIHAPVEIYGTVPIGLTIPRLADVDGRGPDETVGWNVGVGPGINVFFNHAFGINVEPIWLFHHFGIDGTNGNGDVTVKQFSVMINALFAL